jgi:hypothetical protein
MRLLKRHLTALREFRSGYNAYLDATVRNQVDVDGTEVRRRRDRVSAAVAGASEALDYAETRPAIRMGAYSGGGVISGLMNVVFVHEDMPFRSPSFQTVLDATERAIALVEIRRRDAIRKRLNPFFWIDRLLRAVLGFPAYFVSLIFRVPLDKIERSSLALPLRLGGLAIECLLVYFGGHEAGWW